MDQRMKAVAEKVIVQWKTLGLIPKETPSDRPPEEELLLYLVGLQELQEALRDLNTASEAVNGSGHCNQA